MCRHSIIIGVAGSDPHRKERQKGFTPLHIAAFMGNCAVAHELLWTGIALARIQDNGSGATPLHWAIHSGHHAMAKLLLNAGSHPNARDAAGYTPLQLITRDIENSWRNRVRLVFVLAQHGATVADADAVYGFTADDVCRQAYEDGCVAVRAECE